MSAVSTPAHTTLAIVGVGLLGGSVAAAARKHGLFSRIVGAGRNAPSLERARALGLIDAVVDLADAAAQADVLVLAVPVGAMAALFKTMAPLLRPDALVMDVGSTKADVVAAATENLGARIEQFVPAHPIAGSADSGPEAASADLFQGRTVIVTPLAHNAPQLHQRATQLWQALGARVVEMSPDNHDAVLASVSHLPHLLAFAYMAQVASASNARERLDLAGASFRDMTRIAASSPPMWRDIFLANRSAVRAEVQEFKAMLARIETLLEAGEGAALETFLHGASQARRLWNQSNP